MKTFKSVITSISVILTLAVAIPPSLQSRQSGSDIIVIVNNYVFNVNIPSGGWGRKPVMRGVVTNASILRAEKDVKCFLWGSQESHNPRNEETSDRNDETNDGNDETYISSSFTNNQRYIPEAQDSSTSLLYSEVFCYDVSPLTNPGLAVLVLESPQTNSEIRNSYTDFIEGEGRLVMISLDSSGEATRYLDHEPGQTADVMKMTLVDVPNPIVECSVVGRDGEELVSRMGEPSEYRLLRDATHIRCKPRTDADGDGNIGEDSA